MSNAFHAHLDVCRQCADNPVGLCDTGIVLLQQAAQGGAPAPEVFDLEEIRPGLHQCPEHPDHIIQSATYPGVCSRCEDAVPPTNGEGGA